MAWIVRRDFCPIYPVKNIILFSTIVLHEKLPNQLVQKSDFFKLFLPAPEFRMDSNARFRLYDG
ncbi:MAG: hypothetical protein RLZZ628_3141 [Bacteroidota bacterium]